MDLYVCLMLAGNCADVDLKGNNNLLVVIKLQVLQGDSEEIIKVRLIFLFKTDVDNFFSQKAGSSIFPPHLDLHRTNLQSVCGDPQSTADLSTVPLC